MSSERIPIKLIYHERDYGLTEPAGEPNMSSRRVCAPKGEQRMQGHINEEDYCEEQRNGCKIVECSPLLEERKWW